MKNNTFDQIISANLEKSHRLGLHITVGGAYARIPHRIEAVGHDFGTLQRPRTPDAIAFPGVLGQ